MIAVVHTIAGTFAHHGGTSRTVPALCDALAEHLSVSLVTGAPRALRHSVCLPSRAESAVVPEPAVLGRLLGYPRFERTLLRRARDVGASLLHDHGMWLPSNHATARVAARLDLPRVVSPRGMLSGWAFRHRAWKKRFAWGLYQRTDLVAALGFHATSDKEAGEIRRLGFKQPIAVIPNGMECPPAVAGGAGPRPTRRIALFMSRLHPKKGALDLIAAWAQVKPPDWELWLAGPDESGHRRAIEREAARLGLAGAIRCLGEVGNGEKWGLLAQADLFVLPSYDENYGVAVAEALAAGVPVITTTGTPWGELERIGVGWVVPPGATGIARALGSAFAVERGDLAAMGERGRSWAERAMSWPVVGARMERFYEWLLGHRHEKPAWVWT